MTQAEQPVHSPDVTTSVNSSAHCGFSGGTASTIFGPRRGGPDTSAPVPEILEVERYRALGREGARTAPMAKVWMVDARYGRGGTTPRRLRPPWWDIRSPQARRRGKLLLLDTDDGPTLGVRFGMTGGLVVDGAAGARPAALRPGRLRREVGAGARQLRRRGASLAARSRAASARSSWRPTRTDSGPTPSPSPCPSSGRLSPRRRDGPAARPRSRRG